MSDSVWPHRQQPTRFPRPWASPGKNTGMGCHFLLQCMKVKSESEVTQSCPTLSDPMDCSPPGTSIHGVFQARVLEWGAIAFWIRIYGQSPAAPFFVFWFCFFFPWFSFLCPLEIVHTGHYEAFCYFLMDNLSPGSQLLGDSSVSSSFVERLFYSSL